jgi:hypothetical protein
MASRKQKALIGFLGSMLFVIPIVAEDNLATILAPAEGSVLKAEQAYVLEYNIKPEANAEHVHLYVDGDEVGIGHKIKGDLPLGPLKVGERKICISPVNKNHTRTASQACINVMVE